MRRAAKRDIAEPEIVKAIRSAGYWCELLDEPVDLLCGRRGKVGVVLLEIKTDDTDHLTPGQIKFFRQTDGSCVARVQTPDDALRVLDAEIGRDANGGSHG